MVARRSLFLIVVGGCTVLWSAVSGVWQNKPFKDWTEKDAQAIMTNSPWAKELPMPAAARPGQIVIEPGSNGAGPPTAALGNPSSTTTGPNMTNSSYPGSSGPADQNNTRSLSTTPTPSGVGPTGAPDQYAPIRIIWASATPVRLAVLELRSGGIAPSESEIDNAGKPRPNYVIAVAGLPPPDSASDPRDLARSAFLTVRGKTPLQANASNYRKIGNSDVYFFHFTRAALPVTLADQQVEFKMSMGKIVVRKKFDLKEMQYQGQLAL